MIKYMVVGGIYRDTTFTEVVPGTEESYGPFYTRPEALKAWISGTFNYKLDICTHRLFIKEV